MFLIEKLFKFGTIMVFMAKKHEKKVKGWHNPPKVLKKEKMSKDK